MDAADIRVCRTCKAGKSCDAFPVTKKRKDGAPIYRLDCRECLNTRRRERVPTDESRRRTEIRRKARYQKLQTSILAARRERYHAIADHERQQSKAYYHQSQRKSLEQAGNRGKEWTGPELELVARQDLTLNQLAEMLGRSFGAVCTARHKANHDPKFIELLGATS